MNECKKNEFPMIAVRGLVILPNNTVHFDVARKKSLDALETALNGGMKFYAVTQKSVKVENPAESDVYQIGTIVEIQQVIKMPNNVARVLVKGLKRARLEKITSFAPYYKAVVCELSDENDTDSVENIALARMAQNMFEKYAELNPRLTQTTVSDIIETDRLDVKADTMSANIILDVKTRQKLLEAVDLNERLSLLVEILSKEVEILEVEYKINDKVKRAIDKHQKEYYLREQLGVIRKELGEDERSEDEELERKVKESNLPENVMQKCMKEIRRLRKMSDTSPEANVIRTYIETILEIPFNTKTVINDDIENAKNILDEDHYGLEKVKDRIIEYLAVQKLNPDAKGNIICLVGPPGVGKTSVVSSLAKALNRNYTRISLGGMRDEADIRGHRKTYIGAMPGRIINALCNAKSSNPLILLDEIDKMGSDYKGDPAAAMLEVLDYEQNHSFVDHYVELPVDLSDVMFITTANTLDTIPRPLLDRMDVIEISGYTTEEKVQIAKQYLIPKQKTKNGVTKFSFSDQSINEIINYYTRESGVRNLERKIAEVCRKRAKEIVGGDDKAKKVSLKAVNEYLGARKYFYDEIEKKPEIGVVTGLAWTAVGGDTLQIEVSVVKGTGKVELTGSLGDVMQESAKAAISYTRSVADRFNIDTEFYKNTDIHIHVPDGATPKDGPSAGITMATALISALTGVPVKNDVAMTGEISIRGRVLPIGGLKEKSVAGMRAGAKTIIIPKKNLKDLEEVPQSVKDKVEFIAVSEMHEVLEIALCN